MKPLTQQEAQTLNGRPTIPERGSDYLFTARFMLEAAGICARMSHCFEKVPKEGEEFLKDIKDEKLKELALWFKTDAASWLHKAAQIR